MKTYSKQLEKQTNLICNVLRTTYRDYMESCGLVVTSWSLPVREVIDKSRVSISNAVTLDMRFVSFAYNKE